MTSTNGRPSLAGCPESRGVANPVNSETSKFSWAAWFDLRRLANGKEDRTATLTRGVEHDTNSKRATARQRFQLVARAPLLNSFSKL
jgi:hypothetical protein